MSTSPRPGRPGPGDSGENGRSDGLFPELEWHPLKKGHVVRVQTIWGYEKGTVRDVLRGRWPMVEVLMERGDIISIDVARVSLWEGDNDGSGGESTPVE